jgi:predicted ArsR family transcriptional regulator
MASAALTPDLEAIALLDEPVRRRLYEWVVAQGHPVGREEASRSLGITRPLAAFHLDRLAEAGLLDASYKRLTGRTGPGAGRPARVYKRSDREILVSFPPRHYELAADVFAAALQRMGDGTPPPALVEAAHDMGEQIAERAPKSEGAGLIEVLEDAGYEPTVDHDVIRLRNCPFDALVEEHRPLVCGTNLALAQGILDGLSDTDGIDYQPTLDAQPGYCCVVFSRSEDAEKAS